MTFAPLIRDPARTLLALDFDGTLAPIVQDPTQAFIHPRALTGLVRIASKLGQVAIVTGRPVAQVRHLARFDAGYVPEGIVVFGQYGAEWWDSSTGEVIEPAPSKQILGAIDELPSLLKRAGVPDALVENKRIAVAVHTRGLDSAVAERLLEPMQELAQQWGLRLEPGRQVLELRLAGSDKGTAVRELAQRLAATCVIYVGDDLGDLPAFGVLEELRADGIETLSIAVASAEQTVMTDHADTSVADPAGLADWLEGFAKALSTTI